MKPAAFEYHRPDSLEAACDLLADLDDAEVMAGNQSLGIIMSNRLATPGHIVDINHVSELSGIDIDDEVVRVGALTRHRDVAASDALREAVPLFPEAAEQIAGPAVRNMGTVGGSIGEADPAGNYPAVVTALDADLHLASADGERTVAAGDYFIAYMFTDLGEDELITAVEVDREPFPPDRTGMAFLEQKPAAQTWPTISAATALRVEDAGADDAGADGPVVEEARVALANAADVPLRVEAAEEAVEGGPLTDDALDAAAEAAMAEARPEAEMHADAEYKTELAGEYTRRSLRTSYERAVGSDAAGEGGAGGTDDVAGTGAGA